MTTARLQIEMPRAWQMVEQIRCAVAPSLAAITDNPDVRDAIAMVSAELLENAVKHAPQADGELIGFTLDARDGTIVVRVTNPSAERSSSVTKLEETVDWIAGFSDPYEPYVQKLAVAVDNEGDGSGLGLVRVAYEGGCKIRHQINDQQVAVEATFVALRE